jgi:hypothetical protein
MNLTFSEAIGALGEERSTAESGAALLKRYAPQDIESRALSAQAKASFDGLIEQLLADLAQNRDPQISQAFRERLEIAATKRVTFSERAAQVLNARVPVGAKPAWLAAIAAIPADLVKALFEGGIAIWREWRGASTERRKQMTTQIEALRWKPFADISAAM